jgi:high-affinity Fe2+/Pb2+ permease
MGDSQIFWTGAFMAALVAMFFVGTVLEFRRAVRRNDV